MIRIMVGSDICIRDWIWVGLFVLGGYFFGNIPTVRQNFTLVILAIIVISVLPIVIEAVRSRRSRPA
jgi:membrane-associated protein